MKSLKILHYAYLIFALLFMYDAISKWNTDRNGAYISLFFVAIAIFMFFFRKKFWKRFQDRGKL